MKKEKILKFIKIISLSAVAVVIIAIAGVGSYAAISGDTRIFKSIGIMLEGEEQSIEVVENNTEFESGVSYTIDHSDAFTVTKQDNMDIYTSDGIETISGTLYISMKIYSIDDSKCEELRNELDVEMDKMNALFKKMGYDGNECSEEVTIGKGNYKAIYYRLADGNNWDSTIRNVYIIKVGNKQNLIIETSYFLEAAEGYGDTFRQLLSTLEIKNYKPDEISNNNENKDSQKNDTKVDKNEETNKDSWKRHKSSLGYSMCYDSELMDVNVVNSYTIYDDWKGDEEHYTLKQDKSSIKSAKVVVKRVDENINYNEYFEKLKSEHIYVEDKEEADIEVKKGKTTPITWKTSVNGIEAFVTRLYSPEFHSYSDKVSIKVGDKLGYLVDMSYVGGDPDENMINEMVNSFKIEESWKRHKSDLGYSMCYDSELMDVNVVNSYTIYDYWKGDEEHYTLKEDKSSIKSPKVVVKRVDENINYNEYFEKIKSEHIYVENKEEADVEVKKGKTTPITWKTSVNGIEAFVTRLYSPEFHSYSDQVSIKVGDKLGYLVDMSYVGGDSDENKINEMVNSFRIEAN